MPVDSSIALAGKPPVLPEVDFNKTFLTLGQLKYLQSETARTEAQAALAGTQNTAALADLAEKNRVRDILARQRLTTLGTPPPLPAAPGAGPLGGPPFDEATLAALPQGGSTPAPGAPAGSLPAGSPAPAAPARRPTAALAADLYTAGPTGIEIASKLFEHDKQALDATKQQLELGQTRLTIASNAYQGVHDQASLDFANEVIRHTTGLTDEHLVTVYDPARLKQATDLQRTAQQHLDEQFKRVEQTRQQQEADTAEFTAKTGRIEGTKPIPAGTGYFQHPDGTWTPMAPQAATPPGVPGASGGTAPLRSPQWQQVHDAQSQKFEAGSQEFKAQTAAYNEVVPALAQKTNTGDLVALRAFSKLSLSGQAVRGAGGTDSLGNIMEEVEGQIRRLATDSGATIAESLRKKLLASAKVLHAQQIETHLQFRDQVRAEATQQLGPAAALEVAPNRLTTLGSGGKSMSQATFDAYVKAHPGLTRGQAVLDLASGTPSFYVRGGPQ